MIPVLAAFLATQVAPMTAQPAEPPKAEAQKSPTETAKKDGKQEPAVYASLGGRVPAFDFAGGTVVHITSGVSALICALYLGKRDLDVVGHTLRIGSARTCRLEHHERDDRRPGMSAPTR